MQSTPYLLPLLITTILSVLVAYIIWRRRHAPGAASLAILMGALALWTLAYALSLTGTTLAGQLFWANVAFFGIVVVPTSWLTFALAYSGRVERITPHLPLLLIMPLATLAAVWTNEWHGLFRTTVFQVSTGAFVVLEARLGPLFWVHTTYSYVLLLIGTFLLLRNVFRMSPAYRRQAGWLLIGLAAPWAGNFLYLSGLSPFPYLDLTPFAIAISGIALTWDLLRFGLFELVPIAHSTVFQNIAGGVIVLDAQSRIVDINPAALAFVRSGSQHVIGQSVGSAFTQQADLIERYRDVNQVQEELVLDPGPHERAYDLRISPIYDRNGRLSGRVIVLYDITERRRAAAELQRQNEALTILAHENAQLYDAVQQELAERKQTEVSLSLAKEAAEVANRAKGRFLGNMSHELRTPLTAILGYTTLLEVEARQQGYQAILGDVQRIQIAGQHLLALISDVLDLTRIEAEKLELHLEWFVIADLVQQVVATIEPLIEKNGNTLAVECSPESGTMYADQNRVCQILLNLLGNAAKFTEHGRIALHVGLESPTPAEGAALIHGTSVCVSFEISDTGIGMSQEELRRVFDEFAQIDDSPSRKYGGSGLGLAISNRLCQLMGGTIRVTSEPGKGSTFTITLPAQVVAR
jgi:PAS domain S-box-containing protein